MPGEALFINREASSHRRASSDKNNLESSKLEADEGNFLPPSGSLSDVENIL